MKYVFLATLLYFPMILLSAPNHYPHSVKIYMIPMASLYTMEFHCGELKGLSTSSELVINRKHAVRAICDLLNDTNNFVRDTLKSRIDVRVEIDYFDKGDELLKTICFSQVGFRLVEIGNRIYKYNQKVYDYMVRNKVFK